VYVVGFPVELAQHGLEVAQTFRITSSQNRSISSSSTPCRVFVTKTKCA
jgi:hypothetical protein